MIEGHTSGALWALLLAVSLLSAAWGPETATAEPGDPAEVFTAFLKERINDQMETYDVPGVAAALVQEGSLVWSDAFGHADLATRRPMEVDTVNRTESISKSVTAWGVLSLVEEGWIDLDDRVVDIVDGWEFPDSAHPAEDVTVRQLLSHTSGLPLGSIGNHYPPMIPMPELEESLAREAVLSWEPGSRFLYSNVGFNLLELVIEEVSGEDFTDFMERRVLTPLGMDDSSFAWVEGMDLPTGYDMDGDPVPVYVYPEKGSGGLFANVEDVARFVAAGMTGRYHTDHGVLSQDSIQRLYSPASDVSGIFGLVSDSYGLGHFLEDMSGHRAVWHGGQGHGWMTHFHSVPETGGGIVILTNSQRSWPMISTLLGDWSDWIDEEPPGMTLIADANVWLGIGVLLMLATSLVVLALVTRGLIRSDRRFISPLTPPRSGAVTRLVIAGVLIAVLVVGMSLDLWAFFLNPLFPTTAPWLALSLLLLATTLIVSAICPPVTAGGPP